MKRILLSLGMIVFIGGVVAGATGAFFSDTETSTGNTFAAGELDLEIDNSSYGFDWNNPQVSAPIGTWGPNTANSWGIDDFTNQLFFSFDDLKPGDYGEDTISLHVQNNAWACMAFDLTSTPENTLVDPEVDASDVGPALGDNGELQNYLSFLFWNDDGDNVLEVGETVIPELSGLPGSAFTGNWLTIRDQGDTPLQAGATTYIGKGWCFGAMVEAPVAQDGVNTNPPSAPARVGFTCNGAGNHNDAQTDGIVVDVHFYAEQSRNNANFQCSQLPSPDGEQRPLVGAAITTYNDPDPTACNFTVSGSGLIQTAINSAVDENTICVDSSYAGGDTFPVNVDKDLTIAGLGAMGDANIPGGFFISDSGVTITGLEFTNYSFIQASENAAIYIHNEIGTSGVALASTLIDHNIFTAPAGAKAALASGVITEIGSATAVQATGVDVFHNIFNGWRRGMFFNTTDDYEVAFNDILNNDVGVANDGPHNGSIHNNDFETNALEAVGVAPDAANGTLNNGVLTVNTNNFFPAGAGNNVNWYGSSVFGGADVNAENNWWSGEADAARTNNTTEVDTNPFEASAFLEN